MKKLILTSLALVAGVTLGYSQGAITIANTAAGYLISTNTGTPLVSGVVGAAGTGANSYYYTVLQANYGGASPSTSDSALVSATWTWTGLLAANSGLTKGGVGNPNTTTAAAGTFGLPTGSTYSTAPTEYYVIVGWSSIEGTSWSTVANELQNNDLVVGGYFGVSPLAYNEAGGANGLGTVNLLNGGSTITGLSGSGLTSGFDLYIVPTPEPSTIALGVMGAASLLALRRKKA
jgi:hypothetical protein